MSKERSHESRQQELDKIEKYRSLDQLIRAKVVAPCQTISGCMRQTADGCLRIDRGSRLYAGNAREDVGTVDEEPRVLHGVELSTASSAASILLFR